MYYLMTRCLVGVLVAVLLGCSDSGTADEGNTEHKIVSVQVDVETHYQTMVGFGVFGAHKRWWRLETDEVNDEFVETLVNELGVSIIRDAVPFSIEPINDNSDPFVLDLGQFNLGHRVTGEEASAARHFAYLKALKQAGVNTVVATVFSPPLWMKHNQQHGNGSPDSYSAPPFSETPDATHNQLKEEYYVEFAEFCVAYIKLLKRETGIDLYAISLQNEPRFSQFYMSTVYSPQALARLIAVVGKRFELEGIGTKIFAPEDVNSIENIIEYISAIDDNDDAKRYVDILAIHNYKLDGISPSQNGPRNWMITHELGQKMGKDVWMSETSGFAHSLRGALGLAKSMYNALHYGNVSAWIYWQASSDDGNELIVNKQKTMLYYASQQFYKHIRPGAVRTKITIDSDKLLGLSFYDQANRSQIAVLINDSKKISYTATIHGMPGEKSVYVTNADLRHEKLGYEARTPLSLKIDPRSIVSIVTEP